MVREFASSAKTLVWGIGLLVGGVLLYIGAQFNGVGRLAIGYDDVGSGVGLLSVLGGLAAFVGFFVTLFGVWQFATNVDIAAKGALETAKAVEVAQAERDKAARIAIEQERRRVREATAAAATERSDEQP